ncbi:unnamed protein product, partial [Natator depressus]
ELIDLEYVDSLTSGMRQQAMLAIMELSKVKPLLRGMELSSLLNVCFSSTFSLPPAETNQGVEAALYNNTLNTMDELLKALVCEDEKPNLVVLQNIVEVLLPWTASKEVHVRLRAVGRITWLTKFISGQHQFKGLEEFRVLGQLVGCLTLLCAEQEQEICRSAMEGLHHLYAFLLWQKRTTLAKQSAEYLQVFREWRAENTFWVTWFTNTSNIAMMHWVSSKPDPSSLSGVVGASPEINALQGIIASTHQCQPLLSTRECIRAVQYCAPVHCHTGLCHVRQLLIAGWVLCIPGAVTQPCPGRAGFACTPGWATPGCSVRLEPHWAAKGVSLAGFFQMFGKYFNPSEHMDFLLTAIEGMKDTSVHDSVAARHMLHVILWVPSPSLERVSEAVTSIYHNLDSISEPLAQQQLLKALVVLGHQYSEEVVTTLLGCSLSCDSVAVEMWRVLTSHPKTAGKVLRELLNTLQERPLHPHHDVSQQEVGVAPLAIGKLQRQLPVVMERLHEADRDIISNAITVLRDILAGMDRQSASPVAVQVAEKLLPFFHDESSKLRVLSIALFKHLLELVRGPSRRKMKEHVLQSLVPLLLLLHDERPNVSQVCWDTLRSALEFLRWSQLGALVQKKELWRGCDCLVACYKGRAETFLCQAMAFVENPQAPIREAAIRFLGLTARQLDQQSQEKLEAICNALPEANPVSRASMEAAQLTLAIRSTLNTTRIIQHYMQHQNLAERYRARRRRQHGRVSDQDMDTDFSESMGRANACIMVLMGQVHAVERRFCAQETSTDWWDRIVLQVWDDSQWLRNFRMRKGTFMELCDLLSPALKRMNTKMRAALTVEKRVATALWKLATPDSYRSVGNQFGVGKSTVGAAVMQVAHAIKDLLISRVVTLGKVQVIVDGFAAMGFPNCGGAIDGTHIPILAPEHQAGEYINRKGYFSIALQALVDHKGRFTNINMGWPGKVHDAHIFRNSGLFQKLQEGTLFPDQKITVGDVEMPICILGDPAYPLMHWLMKPYTGSLDSSQELFSYRLSKCRMVVECAFGRLKARWRSLLTHLDLSETNIPTVITACCVLHNICENTRATV